MEESTLIVKSKTILSACYPLLEAKRTEKSYDALLHAFNNSHNNFEVLKLIFNVTDDSEEIFELTRPRIRKTFGFPFNGLKDKRVLLIIVSDTNLSEVAFLYYHLSKFHISARTILIPIIDYPQVWTEARMPSVINGLKLLDPCKRITPQFIRFVKERCVPSFQTSGEPIVISLDGCGRLVHTNALHMILTWRGDLAFQLTVGSGNNIISLLQKELTEMSSGVCSVIDDIEKRKCDLATRIENTIDDWRNDINMRIQDSDSSYNYTSKNEEMLWDKETWNLKLLGNRRGIKVLSYTYNIDRWIAYWTSRIEDEDKIFLGLQKLLAYEAKSTTFGAWVLLSKGEEVVACDFGDKMMRVMNAYQKWKNNIHSKGFSQAFKDCYEKFASSQD
nr:protein SIEVE ELEMENT OCCLUSION B-like [Ipomoea batatas]